MGTAIVSGIVLVVVGLAARSVYRDHKRGGCSGCPGCGGETQCDKCK